MVLSMYSTCVYGLEQDPCLCDSSSQRLYNAFPFKDVVSDVQRPMGAIWAVPVRVDLLGAKLDSYRTISTEIGVFRNCHKASKGFLGKLPPEVLALIEGELKERDLAQVQEYWHDRFHCAHGQCDKDWHMIDCGVLGSYERGFHDSYCNEQRHPNEDPDSDEENEREARREERREQLREGKLRELQDEKMEERRREKIAKHRAERTAKRLAERIAAGEENLDFEEDGYDEDDDDVSSVDENDVSSVDEEDIIYDSDDYGSDASASSFEHDYDDPNLRKRRGCRRMDDDYRERLMRYIQKAFGGFYDDDEEAIENDHLSGLSTWLAMIDQTNGQRGQSLNQIMETIFGLEVLIVNYRIHDTYNYHDNPCIEDPGDQVRDSVATYAYIHLPTTFSAPSGSDSTRRSSDHFILANPRSTVTSLSDQSRALITTAMNALDLKPWCHPMQYRQLFPAARQNYGGFRESNTQRAARLRELEPERWPRRVVLVPGIEQEEDGDDEDDDDDEDEE